MEPVIRHRDFRLFACMNPATDVGKKDLSPGIRNRWVDLHFNPLVTNGLSHPYHLDASTSILRGNRINFSFLYFCFIFL